MQMQTLQAEVRTGSGKGPARQLRASGKLPAVFYGPGVETTPLTVSPKELIAALTTEYGINAVLKLSYGGKEELAMVKDLQVHPVERYPIHLDLYRVSTERAVEVRVPLKGTGRALGVQKGGKMFVVYRDLPVRTTPDKIPAVIEIDVVPMDIGDAFSVGQLQLPEGVEVLLPADRSLILVAEAKQIEVVAEDAAPGAAEADPAAAKT